MPGDVLGAILFDFRTNGFRLVNGPVFTDILLADEVNRAPPKTQAALLQVMNEYVATIDGVDHPLGDQFRSEEHTSELQSLMRISYAVFCLKQKKKQKHK